MKNREFIVKNIGNVVYITGDGDLGIHSELRPLIHEKTPLTILKLTRGGMALLQNPVNKKEYSVPPRNVREF